MRNVESIEVGYGEALQFGVSQGTYYKEPEQLLTEAYEAGKRDAIPEGWVLIPKEILDRFPETDPRNYDHDDVCSLNDWGVELVLAAIPKGEE